MWSPGQVPETTYSVLLIAMLPDVKEWPPDTKKPASLTDVATHSLRMLQHAYPWLSPSLSGSARTLDSSSRTFCGGLWRIPHLSGMSIGSYNPHVDCYLEIQPMHGLQKLLPDLFDVLPLIQP